MQIDYHLGVMYVLSRLAGFNSEESNIIAGSSQYVDDAVHEGTLYFSNRFIYRFLSSAHRDIDYRNFAKLANHLVWIPFHFIPGNEVNPNLNNIVSTEVQKLICRPNSQVAQNVLKNCIENADRKFSLYLLGITSHSYVDTWSHQGFAGITHFVNEVSDIFDYEGRPDQAMIEHRDRFFKRGLHRPLWRKILDMIKKDFLNVVDPIGHGTVLSYPDLPYLKWKYKNFNGQLIYRDNPSIYKDAVQHVFKFLTEFRMKHNSCMNKKIDPVILSDNDFEAICRNTEDFTSEEPHERLQQWKESIQRGDFSFGTDLWSYEIEGRNSWLFESFGFESNDDFEFEDLTFAPHFMNSHWKNAQDALWFHQFSILNEILPEFGICAA